jgi:peptide/nickel transport system permease protein
MLAYIARRITLLILVMLGVTFMTFMLMNLAPGDPAEMIAIVSLSLQL